VLKVLIAQGESNIERHGCLSLFGIILSARAIPGPIRGILYSDRPLSAMRARVLFVAAT